jgi:hypothetical protein
MLNACRHYQDSSDTPNPLKCDESGDSNLSNSSHLREGIMYNYKICKLVDIYDSKSDSRQPDFWQ